MYPQLYHHWFPPARSREGPWFDKRERNIPVARGTHGPRGVWGYVLAGVRVIEEGGVIGMGYFVWRI